MVWTGLNCHRRRIQGVHNVIAFNEQSKKGGCLLLSMYEKKKPRIVESPTSVTSSR